VRSDDFKDPVRKRGRPRKSDIIPVKKPSRPWISDGTSKSPLIDFHDDSEKTHQDDASSLNEDNQTSDFSCPFCFKVFTTPDGMMNHVNFKCKKNIDDIPSKRQSYPPAMLTVEKFGSWKEKNDTDESELFSSHSLGSHIKEKTRVCRRDTSDDEAFSCRRCSKEFNSSKTLLYHLQNFCGKDKSDDDDDDDERVDHEVNNRTSSGSNHLIIKLLLSLLS